MELEITTSFLKTRIYGRLRRPMRGLRRTARFARPHPHIESFIKIGQGGPERNDGRNSSNQTPRTTKSPHTC